MQITAEIAMEIIDIVIAEKCPRIPQEELEQRKIRNDKLRQKAVSAKRFRKLRLAYANLHMENESPFANYQAEIDYEKLIAARETFERLSKLLQKPATQQEKETLLNEVAYKFKEIAPVLELPIYSIFTESAKDFAAMLPLLDLGNIRGLILNEQLKELKARAEHNISQRKFPTKAALSEDQVDLNPAPSAQNEDQNKINMSLSK